MKKTKQELLEERVQELNDIISECADAIEDAKTALNGKVFVCSRDYEDPSGTTYLMPAKYAIAGFLQWQEEARIELINLQKSGK